MPTLSNVLASIPGYGAYVARRDMNEQAGMRDLEQASTLQQLGSRIMAQQREDAYRAELAALGPNATQDQLAAVAAKHAAPAAVLQSQTSSLDRKAQIEATKEAAMARIAQTAQSEQMLHEIRLRNATSTEERNAEIERHNRANEARDQQLLELRAEIRQNAPVTTAEVVDPKDPTRMLKIDARTYRGGSIGPDGRMDQGVLGVSGKQSDVQKLVTKRQINSQGVADAVAQARDILQGKAGQELPTGSGFGSAVDYAGSLIGVTPSGAKAADRLRVVGGMLVQKVPRFEGPQSNYDVQYYKEVAGRIGDSTIPIARRLAALDEVENIWGQFEAGQKSGFFAPQGPSSAQTGQGGAAGGQGAQSQPGASGGAWSPEKERRYQELLRRRGGSQ